MRTAVISGPRQTELRQAEMPQLKPGELLVSVQGCGVCGSNIPVWEGRPWFRYPLEAGAPGHEGWGVVHQVANDVDEFRPGDRIAFLSNPADADYDETAATQATHLPSEIAEVPFPAEALGCAMNVFERSAIRNGHTLGIIG